LNCVLRISELKYPDVYKKHPKQALSTLIKRFLLPLLEKIEAAVTKKSKGGEDLHNSIYSVSQVALKLIVFTEDIKVIFGDILSLMKAMYENYFGHEFKPKPGIKQQSLSKQHDELKKNSLKALLNFAREFELCPYLVHQKACFLIWYSIVEAQ